MRDLTSIKDLATSAFKCLAPPRSNILLAVSGGSDSLALMYLAAAVSQELSYQLAIGFVDHGLRNISDEEALVMKQACELGIEVRVARIPKHDADSAKKCGSLQDWAREARYQLLLDTAIDLKMQYIATGHTLDDQVETVLQRIFRGTGIKGLVGIYRSRHLECGVSLIRPLLDVSRNQLKEHLKSLGKIWAADPGNLNPRFSRVRIREELLPLINQIQPGASKHIAALAEDAGAVSQLLNNHIFCGDKIFKNINLADGFKVEYDVFKGATKEVRHLIIHTALCAVQGSSEGIERDHVEAIGNLIARQSISKALPLPRGIKAYVDRGSLYLLRGELPKPPKDIFLPKAISKNTWIVDFQPLKVRAEIRANDVKYVENLIGRTKLPGDRLYKSERKIKKIMTNAKVPSLYRKYMPLLIKDNQVVSCPGLVNRFDADVSVNWVVDSESPIIDINFDLLTSI